VPSLPLAQVSIVLFLSTQTIYNRAKFTASPGFYCVVFIHTNNIPIT